MSIYKKLIQIQETVENLSKDTKAYGYNYTAGSTVLNAIRPLMIIHNLILKQEVIDTAHQVIEYNNAKGDKKTEVLTMCKFKFTWVDADTGETDENLFAADGMNGFDKGLGSALTYAERYFLLKYFHIPTDADDNDAVGEKAGYNKNAPSKQADDDKPWLNIETKDGKATAIGANIYQAVLGGTFDWKPLEGKYKISKKVREQIEEWRAQA